ncbi:MAG TPA: nodulation protein NfeD [Candidatus Omnitrophota bacterium]|nr:nodulation protein NfeD [Candidatus Omnitrophota bacterium]
MVQRFRIQRVIFSAALIVFGLFFLSVRTSDSLASRKIHIIQLNDDTINPVTAEYIIGAIDRAVQENAQCLILKMDTPGGLLNSTRMIVKKMLVSKVPIVVYIAPSGSRAGSAGVFLTYASHVAAMAPSTNIGAAHPVQIGERMPQQTGEWRELKELIDDLKEIKQGKENEMPPGEQESTQTDAGGIKHNGQYEADQNPMESKILQDTVAFIKAIAKERNRNIDWGVESVVKSASITSEEAIEKGVVEILADNEEDLLEKLDGRRVMVNGQEVLLQTKDASVELIEMDSRQKFFNVLANPNIAYFLLILGFYGLLFEVTHPGFGLPGILGTIFLILAFYSMQTLPTNYAGLALLVLGIVFLVAEAFTPTFGVLTLGGLACMILGSMLLFESTDPVMRVSRSAIIAFSLTTAGITLFLMRSVLRAHRAKVHGGQEGLIGTVGEAQTNFIPGTQGKVFVHGELWNAKSDEKIQKGDEIIVQAVEGLTVKIKKK